MAKGDIVAAKESFVGGLGKTTIYVRAGDLYAADDPAVKKFPNLFEPVTVHRSDGTLVEQATAAPGEKRGA